MFIEHIENTYTQSFPEAERRDFSLVRGLIDENPSFITYTLLKENKYVGFITAWQFDDFIYVEHFAIDETARNGGIGAIAMKQFLSLHKSPVVLEVEAPTDELSKRRICFYQRLGFQLDYHPYQQPPYRKEEDWLDMLLMSYGEINLDTRYESVKALLYKHVYGVEE